MSFINAPIIIGIDHGYGNIKTAHFVAARWARPVFAASGKPQIARGASSPHATRSAGLAWGPRSAVVCCGLRLAPCAPAEGQPTPCAASAAQGRNMAPRHLSPLCARNLPPAAFTLYGRHSLPPIFFL